MDKLSDRRHKMFYNFLSRFIFINTNVSMTKAVITFKKTSFELHIKAKQK